MNVLSELPNSSPLTFLSVAPEPGVHSVKAVKSRLSESSFAALIFLTEEKSYNLEVLILDFTAVNAVLGISPESLAPTANGADELDTNIPGLCCDTPAIVVVPVTSVQSESFFLEPSNLTTCPVCTLPINSALISSPGT